MNYEPISNDKKEEWIKWLESQVKVLDGKPETGNDSIFRTGNPDVATGKDLVGNLLALLTGKPVTIN